MKFYLKNFLAMMGVVLFLSSCGSSDRGELVGVKGKKWNPEKPFGMTKIPGGAFIMGKSDDDLASVGDAAPKTVTVRAFYMDETEITNSEYRQFVEWVKDSTMRVRLAILADELGKPKGDGGIGEFSFNDVDPNKMTPYEKYMFDNYYSIGTEDDPYAGRKLNRKVKLIANPKKYPDEYYVEVMDSLYVPGEETIDGKRMFNASKLVFRYTWIDIESAARAPKGTPRKDFIRVENEKIYPDTAVWIKDFSYSYNEPMHNEYFWHQAYSEYPVVGVSWKQAKAFCAWRTMYKNTYIKQNKKGDRVNNFRLPSEAEWEYAARGGLRSATYPWGSLYTKNEANCYLANFKPSRGDYAADGALYTVEAKSYMPNGYNLYNMSGNVSEWTDSSYEANAYEFVSTMNPNVSDKNNNRKVVRGGSWKDVAYALQVGTRDYEYQDSARSYIGFRTVQDYMGTQVTGPGNK